MASNHPVRSFSEVCCAEARAAIIQMENNPDETVCNRIWKIHRDLQSSNLTTTVQVMMVYRFISKRVPEGCFAILSGVNTGMYNPRELKRSYVQSLSTGTSCEFLRSLDKLAKNLLAVHVCSDVKMSLNKRQVIDFLSGEEDPALHTAEHLTSLALDDSPSAVVYSGWQQEAIKLHNTIRKIATMRPADSKAGRFYSDILSACDQTKELLDAFDQGKLAYDRDVVLIGWMDEIIKIFSKPDYLEAKGVSYQVLKNVSNKVALLRESIWWVTELEGKEYLFFDESWYLYGISAFSDGVPGCEDFNC
uniref:Interferon antagonist n=2 Tax=Thogotovirus thogotoense TaxID=11569 RepID=Q80JT6_9ORTO|nr:ML [Thogotovirus thogotoense]QOQ34659.1 interferon antagonist [Thogotovirus thogotoense]